MIQQQKTNTMENLTQTQIQELGLIYFSRKDAMAKDVVECAKTAKAMSIYLGCDFKQGIAILNDFTLAEQQALYLLLS